MVDRIIVIIIHNEDRKSDVYCSKVNEREWLKLRNMESRRMANYSEVEVDLIEKLSLGKVDGVDKIDRFICEKDLSVIQLWNY